MARIRTDRGFHIRLLVARIVYILVGMRGGRLISVAILPVQPCFHLHSDLDLSCRAVETWALNPIDHPH